jgi:hypothetical protein
MVYFIIDEKPASGCFRINKMNKKTIKKSFAMSPVLAI